MNARLLAERWMRLVGRARIGSRRVCFCAIATQDFLPWALVLFDSLRRIHPQASLLLLYVTRSGETPRLPVIEGAHVIGVADLVDAATQATLRRRYSIPELCFSLKPALLLHALERHGDRAFYFDTDIDVHSGVTEAQIALESACAVFTPHLDAPVPMDGRRPTSLTILRAGVYNMGFLGVADVPEARAMLAWWGERVARWGYVAPEFAYQGDQKWMDLAASLFPSAHMLRDPGYNVGYWNLQGRSVVRTPVDGLSVNGQPLCFFHFSGLDPDAPSILSKYQDRFGAAAVPVAMELAQEFSKRIVAARPRAEALQWRELPAMAAPADPPIATHSDASLPEGAYRARIEARHLQGTLETGEEAVIEVTVTNESAHRWLVARDAQGAGGIALTWHLRGGGGDVIFWDNPRTFLDKDLDPGEARSYVVGIRIPHASGRYLAEFDLVHEGISWFVEKGNATATIELMVGLS